MTFADPASPSGIDYKSLQGSLLMFEVLGVEDHIPTAYTQPGIKNPAVRANLTVLDGPSSGLVQDDVFVFPKVLQGQLKSRLGQLVLGRLGQGQAKAGQSAPWKLEPATPADRATAQAWVERSSQPQVSSAAQSEPPF